MQSLVIPFIGSGPGIPAGTKNPVRGSNVDYAPTFLGLADIDTPEFMDGRSIVSALIPNTTAPGLPASVQRHLAKQAASSQLDQLALRNEQFFQYYNQVWGREGMGESERER